MLINNEQGHCLKRACGCKWPSPASSSLHHRDFQSTVDSLLSYLAEALFDQAEGQTLWDTASFSHISECINQIMIFSHLLLGVYTEFPPAILVAI